MGLTHTVSGDVAHFRTPSRVPIESLKFHFLPKQASGTPTPANPIPIEGWTGLNGRRSGKNIATIQQIVNGRPYESLTYENRQCILVPASGATPISMKGAFKANTRYTMSFDAKYMKKASAQTDPTSPFRITVVYTDDTTTPFDVHSQYINEWHHYVLTSKSGKTIDHLLLGSYEFRAEAYFDINTFMFAEGDTESTYEPYQGALIPLTFPVSDDNLFNYDKNNFALENCDAGSGTIIQRQIYHTGLTNGTYVLTAQIKEGYTRPSYNLFNLGVCENNVNNITNNFIGIREYTRTVVLNQNQELLIVSTNDQLYGTDKEIQKYDIEIKQCGMYGGYVDPIAGEIVLTHAKTSVSWGGGGTSVGTMQRQTFYAPFVYKSDENLHDSGYGEVRKRTRCNVANWAWDYYGDTQHYYINGRYIYLFLPSDTPDTTQIEFCAELASPIHIPISPQTMEAYLDHNNFWSDANDITEVSYEVTESKDIQAARKRFEAEENGHHKLVRWNQLILDGAFTDSSKWITNASYGSLSLSNNVAKWTCSTTPDYYYRTGITEKDNHLEISEDHKVLLYAEARSSVAERIALYALVGVNEHSNPYYQNVNANEWTVVCGLATQRSSGKIIGKGKVCYGSSSTTISNIVPGTTLEAKNFMMFDLTQMFGLGNEPSKDEFERICALNGIDLTTYQPYDSGSDRWLIVP